VKLELRHPEAAAALAALDAGDEPELRRLLALHPELARAPIAETDEGYFARPYLLWFVAENPVRTGRLPGNVVALARAIVEAGAPAAALDQAVALVASGRVPREQGAQLALIDALVDAGASPEALGAALAHGEMAAVEKLVARGARPTLAVALTTGRDAGALLAAAGPAERQAALIAAAMLGQPEALRRLLPVVDVNAYGPPGFHPHATALHQAVSSGSLEAVRLLVEAGADREARDRVHGGTPLGWAEHLRQPAIATYLRRA
jgi:peptide-methionine (S)-S-oxide reductase